MVWDRVQRWQLLSRYYVNKWHYDGSKWLERFWYGTGSVKTPNKVASVPFMITRAMRMQLEQAGFPANRITAMTPVQAHELLTKKITHTRFLEIENQMAVEEAEAARKDHATARFVASSTIQVSDDANSCADQHTAPASNAIVLQQDQREDPYHYKKPMDSADRTSASAIVAVPSKHEHNDDPKQSS